ncbi:MULTISPECIES: dTDP-4-dehydrorhamnose reductase [unclassified Beijerinckia]|uniref:dTDP-4-dehydrorhamnose reductase n=1 Tax=unclassified Beijerinckia TaxID=2638183 RepID=UPI00089D74C0|nr:MULTISPECIES: dTDP-4-dehydrorhamnose reductase [unclassified Beijerinckia]MDH7797012.1 dTDP-4-dehydrorhamnose reductase [Beijerinckia sp. GAS462]SEC68649.1 dTDP-4-dehydrorhamnose reductase [Beijerinckia sp. 28-YEA-48]
MAGSILLLGAEGQLGRELTALALIRHIPLAPLSRTTCDITDRQAVISAIANHRPNLIVNAAAYTAVDRAEAEPETAHTVNAIAPGLIAAAAAEADVPLLHISTDYVFDGLKTEAYNEDDCVTPLGVYGRTKEEGERRIRQTYSRHIILRTAWVYGTYGTNFLKTMLRLANERGVIKVVADQRGCPTATTDLAEAILTVYAELAKGNENWGTYHFAGKGTASWYEFAQTIMSERAAILGTAPSVEPITTKDYPTPAQRPANSMLNSSRFGAAFDLWPKPWQDRVREAVASLVR